jgi:hypothetical protein
MSMERCGGEIARRGGAATRLGGTEIGMQRCNMARRHGGDGGST